MKYCVAGQVGKPNYLTSVINIQRSVVHRASEVAEVSRYAVLPNQGMKTRRCAIA